MVTLCRPSQTRKSFSRNSLLSPVFSFFSGIARLLSFFLYLDQSFTQIFAKFSQVSACMVFAPDSLVQTFDLWVPNIGITKEGKQGLQAPRGRAFHVIHVTKYGHTAGHLEHTRLRADWAMLERHAFYIFFFFTIFKENVKKTVDFRFLPETSFFG